MDLDRGTYVRRVDVNPGPTLGLVWAQIGAQTKITTGGTTTLDINTQVALVNFNGSVVVALPSVLSWLNAPAQPFDGAIWVKDLGGFASAANPITVVPNGTDTIDGQANYKIINPMQLLRIYPLIDATGWFLG